MTVSGKQSFPVSPGGPPHYSCSSPFTSCTTRRAPGDLLLQPSLTPQLWSNLEVLITSTLGSPFPRMRPAVLRGQGILPSTFLLHSLTPQSFPRP